MWRWCGRVVCGVRVVFFFSFFSDLAIEQRHIRRLLHLEELHRDADKEPRDAGAGSSAGDQVARALPEEGARQPLPLPRAVTYKCEVEIGHNTFDLVSKLLSARLVTEGALRVLTTDAEFYSFSRQVREVS
jgi:hypothetical protein